MKALTLFAHWERDFLVSKLESCFVVVTFPLLFMPTGIPQRQEVPQQPSVPSGFEIVDVNSNLDPDAVGFAILPDGRILIINQFSGNVKLLTNGILKSEPLLTISNLAGLVEKGLLGIAVDPDFPTPPYIYLFYTYDSEPDLNRVCRFTLSGDLSNPHSDNLAIDPRSEVILIPDMPANSNSHNGGTIRFTRDKTLLVSHGDDKNRGEVQNLTNLKGKILRINRDGSIPHDNPTFPEEPVDKRPELFAFGFRNPFRFTIDRTSGSLFVGDVGQDSREEIDEVRPIGGQNFGWPRFEGSNVFDSETELIPPSQTPPIFEYHIDGKFNSVVALVAYRQQEVPNDFSFPSEYEASIFYADFFDDKIHNLRPDTSSGWVSTEFATGFSKPVDGTLGQDGSIYILEYGTALRKIIFINTPVPVELGSFQANILGHDVILTWQTFSESNVFGFEVQKRSGARNFERVAFLRGGGSPAQTNAYRFKDVNPKIGTNSYRLKQMFSDGSFKYSPVVSVEIAAPKNLALMQNYPNPFNGTTKIHYRVPSGRIHSQGQALRLTILNIRGSHVRTLVDQIRSPGDYFTIWDGKNQHGLNVASGVYVYLVRLGEFSESKKMIYLR